jgi:hypothetical protein
MRHIPAHLTPKGPGSKFWKKVLGEFELEDPHHLQLLDMACGCLDRIHEAQKEIEADGAFIPNRFGISMEHPGQKVERDNKILFARCIRELCLDSISPEEAYPRPKPLESYRGK